MKKGFTLIELLAVITALSLLLIITYSNVIDTKDKVLDNISELEKKNIKEAANLLAADLDNPYSPIYNCKNSNLTCTMNQNADSRKVMWVSVNVDINYLKENKYLETNKECSGTISIVKNLKENNNYVVDINFNSDVSCN